MSKEVVDQNEPVQTRGRAGKASRSRDMLTALENRVVNLEESVGNIKETLELIEGRADGFDAMEEQLRDFVLDSLGATSEKMYGLVNSATEKLEERDDALEGMMVAMKKEIEELKGELTIYKVALSNGMLSSRPKQQAMDVPKPEKFKGARSARDVDNFLWEMEQYFRAMGIEEDAIKVNTASIYFTDVALLWWRRRSTDERRGGNAIGTWEQFQRELKKQFYPQYAEKEARARLRRLTQQGTVREYVRAFSELMLQISDLSEKEAFYWFEDGLKPWAKHELRRQGITELTVAMAEAESFVELGTMEDKLVSSEPDRMSNDERNHGEDQDSDWKGKEDFEVIQLDDYDFVLGLNFLDRIQTVLFPFANEIHIVTGPSSKIVVPVHRDMKVGTKVLSSIQLVEDVSDGGNINSIVRNATKAPSKKLVERESDMRPVESTVKTSPLGKVDCVSDFVKEEVIREQSRRVNAASKNWGKTERRLLANAMYQRVQTVQVRSDGSRGKSPERREKLRRQIEIEANQVSVIQESQRGRCENGWGRMSRVRVRSPRPWPKMRPMEVDQFDGDHLAHENWPDSKSCWRSLSD
ncbi:hypothetical protein J1N35_013266 [Gossypium stocksii]|uniref:Retrotransposon gag domain-containing protein n=1 Tax=Gossypium stocksii TaxID=47602 RepID=A0A9D3VSG3_9ROSI|nr:hypothetical protein J1N35_013266 [Gossypium stocksii]